MYNVHYLCVRLFLTNLRNLSPNILLIVWRAPACTIQHFQIRLSFELLINWNQCCVGHKIRQTYDIFDLNIKLQNNIFDVVIDKCSFEACHAMSKVATSGHLHAHQCFLCVTRVYYNLFELVWPEKNQTYNSNMQLRYWIIWLFVFENQGQTYMKTCSQFFSK